ncbi:MAG: MotA/TolQ/ExbB proton channel family protein [Sulfurimonas sp.]|nr:MotA/TolQ/ExbB proton channel family protein [Sulfurimonas sp.]
MQVLQTKKGCSANFVVISTIPVLFFLFVSLGFIGIIPLNISLHTLAILAFILFIFLLFISHNANYSICKMRNSYADLEEEIQTKINATMLRLGDKNKSVLDLENYLHTHYSDIRNNNFVSVASSIFPMLGILGTFIAIAISMPNFSVKETAALDNEISMLLSGVGSAFFASIYGILLSLIWTYFEKRGLSKVDAYFALIKNSFAESLWTKEELLIQREEQNNKKEQRLILALKETFDLDFIKTLNTQHLESFEKIMHESNQNFTVLATHLYKASDDLKDVLGEVDKSQSAVGARNHIDKALVDFTVATRSFEKTTKLFSAELNSSLSLTFTKIDSEVGNIVIKLADFAAHVSQESQEVQESIRKYHQMVANQVRDR